MEYCTVTVLLLLFFFRMTVVCLGLKTDQWAVHDALEEDEVQVIGSGGAGAVTQCVQHM